MKSRAYGSISALGAFLGWGIAPLFWVLLNHIPPLVLVFHRFFWSAVILWIVHLLWGNIIKMREIRGSWGKIFVSSLMLFTNWVIFTSAVQAQQTISASLGYAISPLMSVMVALIFFRESLRALEWVALSVAVTGVLYFLIIAGGFSLFSLGVALTFTIYGAVKKSTPVSGVQALTLEMSINSILSLVGLFVMAPVMRTTAWSFLLPAAGLVTMIPLTLYTIALHRISYTRLAFFQYITPSLMFLVSLLLLHEDLPLSHIPGYAIIWTSLLIYLCAKWNTQPPVS